LGRSVNVAIRVDGGNAVGMGHVVECLSLARSLRRRANCRISFLTEESPAAIHQLRLEGDRLCVLPGGISEADEIRRIRQFCRENGIGILVVDLLGRGDSFYTLLKDDLPLLVAILDDAQHRPLPCDMVVNFHILQRQECYPQSGSNPTQYLIGSQYVLLDESYHREWQKEKPIPQVCQTILINQGGSDPYGLTAKTLRALRDLKLSQRVMVVIGPALAERHRRELHELSPSLGENYEMLHNVDPPLMRQLMAQADLAITAAGNTLYELAVMGVPSITVCHHERHDLVASHFAQLGAAINLGIGTRISEREIAEAVAALLADRGKRADLSAQMKKITDGNGAARVAEAILQRGLG
jgi:UDP-2,4-diacetamido-2,4,6-trideoxy-beta-L-altropyranose hydrolase